jgi:hypothetical protein
MRVEHVILRLTTDLLCAPVAPKTTGRFRYWYLHCKYLIWGFFAGVELEQGDQ